MNIMNIDNKDIIFRYMKYNEYIIKISSKHYFEICNYELIIDKNNACYYQNIKFNVVSIEHMITKLPLLEILIELPHNETYTLEINKIYEKNIKYFATYERAFLNNFIDEKQYLLFDNYSGIFTDYYDNGQIKETYFHTNGLINGIYKNYYENITNINKIHIECNYINGKRHGEYKKYYYSGNINIHAFYNNDNLICDYKVYNKNNILTYYANYEICKILNTSKLISYIIFHPISGNKINDA